MVLDQYQVLRVRLPQYPQGCKDCLFRECHLRHPELTPKVLCEVDRSHLTRVLSAELGVLQIIMHLHPHIGHLHCKCMQFRQQGAVHRMHHHQGHLLLLPPPLLPLLLQEIEQRGVQLQGRVQAQVGDMGMHTVGCLHQTAAVAA
jgi:hypothetical protein